MKLPVSFIMAGESQGLNAEGSCWFSNPYVGATIVWCVANTEGGSVAGAFKTDGKPPVEQKWLEATLPVNASSPRGPFMVPLSWFPFCTRAILTGYSVPSAALMCPVQVAVSEGEPGNAAPAA